VCIPKELVKPGYYDRLFQATNCKQLQDWMVDQRANEELRQYSVFKTTGSTNVSNNILTLCNGNDNSIADNMVGERAYRVLAELRGMNTSQVFDSVWEQYESKNKDTMAQRIHNNEIYEQEVAEARDKEEKLKRLFHKKEEQIKTYRLQLAGQEPVLDALVDGLKSARNSAKAEEMEAERRQRQVEQAEMDAATKEMWRTIKSDTDKAYELEIKDLKTEVAELKQEVAKEKTKKRKRSPAETSLIERERAVEQREIELARRESADAEFVQAEVRSVLEDCITSIEMELYS